MNESSVIQTRGLTKYFGNKCAVYELNLEVPRGSVFAFLGRNGSGKTTTIRMLMGLLAPTRGGGSIFGQNICKLTPEIRARIGYLTEEHQLYGWMNVKQSGEFQSKFFPKWNAKIFHGVVSHFGLKPAAKVKDLSRGERAGLCLALTLAPEPELLVLDDPALGLDPVARRSLLQSMLYVTRQPNRTILFSSHLLSDVERVADRIVVLDGGVLRADCTVELFRERLRHYVLKFRETPPPTPNLPGLLESFRTDRELALTLANTSPETDAQLAALQPESIEPVEMTLEDAFVSYVGERGEKSFFIKETKRR